MNIRYLNFSPLAFSSVATSSFAGLASSTNFRLVACFATFGVLSMLFTSSDFLLFFTDFDALVVAGEAAFGVGFFGVFFCKFIHSLSFQPTKYQTKFLTLAEVFFAGVLVRFLLGS